MEARISQTSDKKVEPKLSKTDLIFMKRVEQVNKERVEKLLKIRKANVITAWSLGLFVVGIYTYTMHAVKQETFLDDFEPPKEGVIVQEEL